MNRLAQNPLKFPVIFIGLFLIGLMFGMIFNDGSKFRSVWVQSYLKMHSSLVPGQSEGRLIVIHNDFSALSSLAENQPSILTVSQSQFSNVAYVTVEGYEEPVLSLLRSFPFVRFVTRNQMIFFCH